MRHGHVQPGRRADGQRVTVRATVLFAAVLAVATLSAKENGSSSFRELPGGVIERCEKLNARNYPQITLFLRRPPGVDKPRGVLCLCLLGNNPEEIGEKISKGRGGWYAYAEERGLAILGWGSRSLWDPNLNWSELPKDRAHAIDESFDAAANGWDHAVRWFAQHYGIPESGFLMYGSCGAGQFVQRLALRKPERFLAVHMNLPGSYDRPYKDGNRVLWCLTTGERLDGGYARSLEFFAAVRALRYPIVYKAYPGVSHGDGASRQMSLGRAVFDYALAQYERATRLNKGTPTQPDWADIFASAATVADIRNQCVFPVEDYACVALGFRMLLPEELTDAWLEE